ncbi:MAG: hypothetical protein IH908_02030 [Proteobacteria bacterium]|nr:hypothetical protein [Pseudomonadota bacterium]
MKATKTTFHLLIAVLMSVTFGCVTYEEGSLLQLQHQQEQRLYIGCVNVQMDRNMQYVVDISAIAGACRSWARKRMKPYLPTGDGRSNQLTR